MEDEEKGTRTLWQASTERSPTSLRGAEDCIFSMSRTTEMESGIWNASLPLTIFLTHDRIPLPLPFVYVYLCHSNRLFLGCK